MPKFVHLNLHSEYSIMDGMLRIKPLLEYAQATGMAAIALTDHMNLFAAVKFYKAAVAAGVKPIFGAELMIVDQNTPHPPFHIIALCINQIGYHHLTTLISKGYTEGQQMGSPHIQLEWLKQYHEGLIILSGGIRGDIGYHIMNNDTSAAQNCLTRWLEWFPDRFYLEIHRLGFPKENHYLQSVLLLAQAFNVPVVATNTVRFFKAEDFEAHEARVSIQRGETVSDPNRARDYTANQYLRSEVEMQQLFADLPVALSNTVIIAKRCNVSLKLGTYYLPDFPVPTDKTIVGYFTELAQAGLAQRMQELYGKDCDASYWPKYQARLHQEIEVITTMGFAGYFLIVADFIQWAKQQGIPVGPGRGSGAGSLVAYVLQITDLDPITYDLLFERFLNPERISMPDFDIDFCMDGRDRVIEYVAQKYGRECVSQIITYGSMAAKAVVRDVGRVLGYPYGFVDKIAKLIPFELGITLQKALAQEELLAKRYQEEDDVKDLLDLAQKLEGLTRNAGKHAGGVVIAPTPLTDFCPLFCEPDSDQVVTQFDKDDVDAIGLVKFDFLGLRTLTIIDWAMQVINARLMSAQLPKININRIPLDDTQTFALLCACQTTAVFQLESRGMKDLIKRLQPDRFDEIVALMALFRPGPLQSGMVDDFINRKHGRANVNYPHPSLEPILSPTYGVILYQEQIMQIAQVLAGYTLGGADLLRRAIGKKKIQEMAKQRQVFIKGALSKGVEAKTATYIFDLIEKFADYGFNKSHSAAYALVAYQTAWLKAHYPAEFMAAVLSSDMDNTDKIVILLEECKQLRLCLLPPDVNQSLYKFSVTSQGEIRYGLGAIKGVGEGVIEALVQIRQTSGIFNSFFDFCQRMDQKKTNRRVLEAFIKSGAMDCFGIERSWLLASVDKALKLAEQILRERTEGQGNLFTLMTSSECTEPTTTYVTEKPWPPLLRLEYEKEVLGFYLNGHPLEYYQLELAQVAPRKICDVNGHLKHSVTIAGQITQLRFLMTKRGDRIAFIGLEDPTGRIDVGIFADVLPKVREYLVKDTIIVVEGAVSADEYSGGLRLTCEKLYSLEQIRQQYAKACLLSIQGASSQDIIEPISHIIHQHQPGKCALYIDYRDPNYHVVLRCDPDWQFTPTKVCLEQLGALLGTEAVNLRY